ncbi:MAG: (d)CMP kinase [Clostridia bacterium]|nr:(d)CMP kinase [Clostridia bacterium]
MKNINIAVDGPAGAGKSTVSKIIAEKLGLMYLDTGAMYRAVAFKALENDIDPNDYNAVLKLLKNTKIDIKYIDGVQHIMLDGKDVSESVRRHKISQAASDISKIKEVRLMLVEIQREIARQNSVIMDGRDIGSFVLPNADYKFYITAIPEERAKRRLLDLREKGQDESFDEILKSIMIRDENDKNRDFAPLIKAEDAILIDTTNLNIEQVCEKVLSIINISKE